MRASRELGKDVVQRSLRRIAPLFSSEVGIGDGEARAPAEQQAVVRRGSEVVDEVLRIDRHAAARQ